MTRKMEASSLRHASVVVVVAAALVVGCGKNRADPKTAAHREGSRPTEVVHEACNVESAQEKLDATRYAPRQPESRQHAQLSNHGRT